MYCIVVDTGRGAMAVRKLKACSVLISIPEQLLITTHTVLASSLGHFIKQ